MFQKCCELLESNAVSSQDAVRIVDALSMNLDTLPPESLVVLCEYFVNALKGTTLCSGRSFELFPKILGNISLVSQLPETLQSGQGFVELALNKFCNRPWPPSCVVRIAAMFRDVPLSVEQQSLPIDRLIRCINEMDIDELPPLIYQMLLLANKVHNQKGGCGHRKGLNEDTELLSLSLSRCLSLCT